METIIATSDNPRSSFSAALRARRLALRYSQAQIAEKAKLSIEAVEEMENGGADSIIATIQQLFAPFHVKIVLKTNKEKGSALRGRILELFTAPGAPARLSRDQIQLSLSSWSTKRIDHVLTALVRAGQLQRPAKATYQLPVQSTNGGTNV